MAHGNLEELARDYLAIQCRGLESLSASIGPKLLTAVEHVAAAESVVVCGVGKSWHIGRKIAATLTSTGTRAIALHAAEARHGDIGVVREGDVALVLSFSGESEEIRDVVPLLKDRGITTIALTRCGGSWLGGQADICLDIPVEREACRFNLVPTTSSLATLALGDLLAVLVSERRGFTRNDFGALHPAGAIGHSLRPVGEVMRSGSRLAAVERGVHLREALVAMTSARCGAVVVTDETGAVCGVLTDGDVRRHLAASGTLEVPVGEVMSAEPITIPVDAPVADAWAIFREEEIDDLVVVEADGTLAGLLDLQDLPKLKQV